MKAPKPLLHLGTSTYSYWHLDPELVTVESVMESAAQLGLQGVELLHKQLEGEDPFYVANLKRYAFRLGLDLYNLQIDQDFVWQEEAERKKNIDYTRHCINLAHDLGIPSIRIDAGGWCKSTGDTEAFHQALLESNGLGNTPPGVSDQEAFQWATDAIAACIDLAEERGVMLLLENRWGLTSSATGMLRILETINSSWLRAMLNVGNFLFEPNIYTAVERIAPYVWLVHAPTYPGGVANALDANMSEIDYVRVFRILTSVGFTGYVSIEMKGNETAETAMPKSIAMLRSAWDRANR